MGGWVAKEEEAGPWGWWWGVWYLGVPENLGFAGYQGLT